MVVRGFGLGGIVRPSSFLLRRVSLLGGAVTTGVLVRIDCLVEVVRLGECVFVVTLLGEWENMDFVGQTGLWVGKGFGLCSLAWDCFGGIFGRHVPPDYIG